MIKLTKSNINTLIAKYFEDEGYVYSKFTFTAESKLEIEHIRKNIDLVSLIAMGLQYLYGVEHFIEDHVTPCDVLYTLLDEHKCDTAAKNINLDLKIIDKDETIKKGRPKKKRKIKKQDEQLIFNDELVSKKDDTNQERAIIAEDKADLKIILETVNEIQQVDEGDKTDKIIEINVENKNNIDNDIDVNKETIFKELPTPHKEIMNLVGSFRSDILLEYSERPLTECKEAERISWNGDYLAVKTVTNELFAFRFGCFIWKIGIVNISAMQWNELGLATGEIDGRVVILNPQNYRRKIFEKHTDVVTKLLYKDKKMYTCSKDGYILTTDDSFSLKVFSDGIKDAIFLGDGTIYCASFGLDMALADLKTGKSTLLKKHSSSINGLDQCDGIVSCTSEDGLISLYNTGNKQQIFFKSHTFGVNFHCWVGGLLVSAGRDNIIKIWDKNSIFKGENEPISKYKYPGTIKKMKASDEYLALISDDQTISLFDKHMGLISRYSLVGTPKDFDFSESGDSICVLLSNNYPVIINLMKCSQLDKE
uniref:Anti-telomeric silencing protein n=1 Tax=Nosema pernyi TaxID=1112939 RepID=A0A0N7ABU4_9MICR|nr:anti-telomeric silencing protein [Nosema pernyi]